MRIIKFAIFVLILLTLGISSLQFSCHLFKEPPLKGYFHLRERPSLKLFAWKRWISSTFQDEFSNRLNDNIGLRNSLIRINNQGDYSFFGIIHAEGFINGKQRYLFEEDYIHEYTGEYFIGKEVIDKKLARLKNVTDSLKARHILLMLVYEPGKASFYPEYIPRRFHPEKRGLTNFGYYLKRSCELGLSCMDLNSYFLKMKDTSRYPLFPRYGMHWSVYGVPYALDTLANAIQKTTGTELPKYKTTRLIASQTPRGTDNDIGELLNLICPLTSTPAAYPSVSFEKTPPKTLTVLVVADSYYLNIIEDYGRQLFRKQEFWYYNKKMYPYQNNNPPQYVDKSNLRDKLKKFDVILLMVSEINLHCGFWNFADEAFMAFHPELKDPLLYGIENDIRNDREWFRSVVNKSRVQKKPLNEIIRADAEFTFYNNYDNLPNKSYWDTIRYVTLKIRNSAGWLSQVAKKAHDRDIPLDSMLVLDAIYSYDQSKKIH